jgi:tricorn protease
MWAGDKVYFRSDRDGEFNLYVYDTRSKSISQLTRHTDFPVLNAALSGSRILYEQAGYLHLLDLESGAAAGRRLAIGVSTDLGLSRERWVRGAKYIRNSSISPSGARVAFEFRGDIVTLPAEKGVLPGRQMAARLPIFPMKAVSMPCTSGNRTARESCANSS